MLLWMWVWASMVAAVPAAARRCVNKLSWDELWLLLRLQCCSTATCYQGLQARVAGSMQRCLCG